MLTAIRHLQTTFNAESAEAAEENPRKLSDLCVLCVKTL